MTETLDDIRWERKAPVWDMLAAICKREFDGIVCYHADKKEYWRWEPEGENAWRPVEEKQVQQEFFGQLLEQQDRILQSTHPEAVLKRIAEGEEVVLTNYQTLEAGRIHDKLLRQYLVPEKPEWLLCVCLDLTGATTSLSQALQQEQKINAERSEYLRRVSHDLRIPMNGIMGMTVLTQDIKQLPEEARINLNAIQDSSRYLLRLINEMQDASRMENRKLEFHREPVLASELIDGIMESLMPQIEERELELIVTPVNLNLGYIRADGFRIRQIFMNLATFALRFIPQHGKLEVILECIARENNHSQLRVVLRDNGDGIDPEFLAHAMEPFSPEQTESSNYYAGMGLELSIIKNLIEQTGGSLQISSEPEVGTEMVIQLEVERLETYQPGAEEGEPEPQLEYQGYRVLLCEDHPLNAAIEARLLEKKGFLVDLAKNGKSGVSVFAKSPKNFYSVILMDLQMPVMDGLEASRKIRQLNRRDAKTIPIIAMTGNTFEQDIQNCMEAGMNAHLPKPIEPKLLYDTILTFISR